jgi:hypothetical protein
MTAPPEGIDRLIHFVEARLAQLKLSKTEIARRGGPGVDTLSKARRQGLNTPTVATLMRLDAVLGWQPGSAAVALLGGNPLSLLARRKSARQTKHPLQPLNEGEIEQRLTTQLREELDRLEDDRAAVDRRIELLRRVIVELSPDEELAAEYDTATSLPDANSA